MTAICPGSGPSAAKPGTPEYVSVGAAAIEAAIELAGFPEVAAVLAPLAVAAPFETVSFCSQDPPADPGLTPLDVVQALDASSPATFVPAVSKVRQWFAHQYWYALCECTAAPTPAPTPPSDPSTGVDSNTGLPTGTATKPCWSVDSNRFIPAAATHGTFAGIDMPEMLPGNPVFQFTIPPATWPGPTTAKAIPPGANNATWIGTSTSNPASGFGNDNVLMFFDTNHTWLSSVFPGSWTGTEPLSQSGTVAIPANAVYWAWHFVNNGDTNSRNLSESFQFFCTGGPNGLNTPCCPPDPIANNYLTQILNIVMNIQAELGQGAGPQKPYVDATRHRGLSGDGTIAIQPSSRAIRLEVTSSLAGWPQNQQVPEYYFSLGFITPFAVGTPLRGQRLIYNHQTFAWPTYTDTIGYTLEPGVSADLVELT